MERREASRIIDRRVPSVYTQSAEIRVRPWEEEGEGESLRRWNCAVSLMNNSGDDLHEPEQTSDFISVSGPFCTNGLVFPVG